MDELTPVYAPSRLGEPERARTSHPVLHRRHGEPLDPRCGRGHPRSLLSTACAPPRSSPGSPSGDRGGELSSSTAPAVTARQAGGDPAILSGDENASSTFVTRAVPSWAWYFDHHATAFGSDEEREDFERDAVRRQILRPELRLVHQADLRHLARVRAHRYPGLIELVRWADIIDAARFPWAEMAVLRAAPALWLMTVVENYGDEASCRASFPASSRNRSTKIARSPEIQAKWIPLRDAHLVSSNGARRRAKHGRVVYVDLSEVGSTWWVSS